MFTDSISESWDSTELQDNFIKQYFKKDIHPKKKKKKGCRKTSEEIKAHAQDLEINNDVDEVLISTKAIASDSSSLKNKKKRKKKLRKKSHKDSLTLSSNNNNSEVNDQNIIGIDKNKSKDNLNIDSSAYDLQNQEESTPLQNLKSKLIQGKAYKKLQAAKFRYLNEILYTSTGKDSSKYFLENKDEFEDYHLGYQAQVSKWPLNPVDVIIKDLKRRKNISVIADLGCGEAKIAKTLTDRTVHSFDLVSLNSYVIACDVANVPLPDESVAASVFCLSLMGTNYKEYVLEANRILKLGGLLKIAEIESRIKDIEEFVQHIQTYGFTIVNKDLSHKMFVFLNFKKTKKSVKASKVKTLALKPCLYKKR